MVEKVPAFYRLTTNAEVIRSECDLRTQQIVGAEGLFPIDMHGEIYFDENYRSGFMTEKRLIEALFRFPQALAVIDNCQVGCWVITKTGMFLYIYASGEIDRDRQWAFKTPLDFETKDFGYVKTKTWQYRYKQPLSKLVAIKERGRWVVHTNQGKKWIGFPYQDNKVSYPYDMSKWFEACRREDVYAYRVYKGTPEFLSIEENKIVVRKEE